MEKKKHEITRILARKFTKILVFFGFVFVIFGVSSSVAEAASLYFSPSSGSHAVGTTFSVSAYVSSADQAMNAASGVISFPKDKLEVVSVSKSGSIFSLWVQEPSFSNGAGTVNLEGIALNPGFTGASGKLITVNFRVKAAGVAALNFSSGSALANDGQGTNILAGLGKAQFNLGGETPVPETPAPSDIPGVSGPPSVPKVSSSTHPDSNKWYNNKNPRFSWALPAGVTGVGIYFSQSPTSNPGPVSDGSFTSKSYENVDDGIWYFHIKMKNSAGWGGIFHFRLQIDTEKPSRFDIREIERKDPTDPRVKFIFDSRDEISGVDYYEVQIDDGSPQVWQDDGSGVFEAPALGPGKHTLITKVFDKAGNSLANSAEFTIEALKSPTIIDYPKTLASGEVLIVKGTAYPNAQAVVWLQKEKDEPQSQIVKSDDGGNFTFVAEEKLKDGIYKIWAEAVDSRGAKSLPTEKIIILVAKSAIFRIGTWTVSFLSVVIPLVVLIIALLLILWYGWRRFSFLRKRLRKEVREAESALHRVFDTLKEDIREQVKLLEKTRTKRQLTEEEDKIVKRLKKDLDVAEKLVRKEIEDIEKEVK
ncbi:hypothetical protein HZB93_03960 [Candidatus Falkowbacteria bacterium]|nr:hypothetical protein [Candidatus Falkowbacteria bacterium]